MYLVNLLSAQSDTIAVERYRTGQELVGVKDGVNTVFTVPFGDKFTHNLPFFTIQLYFNGVRQKLLEDYTIGESGGLGTGYDTITLNYTPIASDYLTADYISLL